MATKSLIQEVKNHLIEVTDDPTKALDQKLLDQLDAQIGGTYFLAFLSSTCLLFSNFSTETLADEDRDSLINQLSSLLPTLQQDPSPATSLIEILIRPSTYTFTKVLSIKPPVDFVLGFSVPSPPINDVTLDLLGKASDRISDIGIIAGKPEVIAALLRLWLCTPDTAIAQKALSTIAKLLCGDYPIHLMDEEMEMDGVPADDPPPSTTGQGLMWRRIFHDKDVYAQIFSICSLATVGQDGQPSKREKSVAQARLLDFLKIFADFEMVRTSQMPEIEESYGVINGGLLDFASLRMVDYKDDVLIHMTLIDFFAAYLSADHGEFYLPNSKLLAQVEQPASKRLEFLIAKGLHARTISYYIEPDKHDSMDFTYLYGRSANYIAAHASTCPTHLLRSSGSDLNAVLLRLGTALQSVSSTQWAHGNAPQHDLHLLTSLPREALLPTSRLSSPLFYIPAKPSCADAFYTLATIFKGPQKTDSLASMTYPNDSSSSKLLGHVETERAAARALCFLYVHRNSDFWSHVISAAETVALKENALAAITLIGAIVNSNWGSLPTNLADSGDEGPFSLPTENQLASECQFYGGTLPASGALSILTAPALQTVLPYLLKPAQTFSNLVGGRGDSESAAYKIAIAKHDVLILLHRRLRDAQGANEAPQDVAHWQDLLETIRRRIGQGPLGGSSEVGGRVGTLEL